MGKMDTYHEFAIKSLRLIDYLGIKMRDAASFIFQGCLHKLVNIFSMGTPHH
jgi:hypothetical protein